MSAPSVPATSATGVRGAYGAGGRFSSSSRAHPAAAVVRGITPRPSHSPAVGASAVVLQLLRPMACKWYVLDTQTTVPHVRQYVWYSTLTFGSNLASTLSNWPVQRACLPDTRSVCLFCVMWLANVRGELYIQFVVHFMLALYHGGSHLCHLVHKPAYPTMADDKHASTSTQQGVILVQKPIWQAP